MKIFYITLLEMIENKAELEIMAEDEPTAYKMALASTKAKWSETYRDKIAYKVQVLIDHGHAQ